MGRSRRRATPHRQKRHNGTPSLVCILRQGLHELLPSLGRLQDKGRRTHTQRFIVGAGVISGPGQGTARGDSLRLAALTTSVSGGRSIAAVLLCPAEAATFTGGAATGALAPAAPVAAAAAVTAGGVPVTCGPGARGGRASALKVALTHGEERRRHAPCMHLPRQYTTRKAEKEG